MPRFIDIKIATEWPGGGMDLPVGGYAAVNPDHISLILDIYGDDGNFDCSKIFFSNRGVFYSKDRRAEILDIIDELYDQDPDEECSW